MRTRNIAIKIGAGLLLKADLLVLRIEIYRNSLKTVPA